MEPAPVIIFDLGDTLVEYEGLPLSWETHYPEALAALAATLGLKPDAARIDAACAVLRRHNTRLHPRVEEIGFAAILAEIAPGLGVPRAADVLACARAFFGVFRQRLRCFGDTLAALTALKQRGCRIGVFTDVPYGMPRELVEEDIRAAGLAGAFDLLVTSTDIGCRKPSPLTLQHLSRTMSCPPADMVHVGNEKKDVEVAQAFGCPAILLNRHGPAADWGQDRTISLLSEL